MLCPYCEEYDVDTIPVGGGICEFCMEYSIPEEEET